MPKNQLDNPNPKSVELENKKQKTVANEENESYWDKLPEELAESILSDVHHDEESNKSSGLLPNYARVNKQFYGFFKTFSSKNYKFMVYCLIGPEGFQRLTESKPISPKDYQSAFLYIKDKVRELAKSINFELIEKILTVRVYSLRTCSKSSIIC